MKIGICEDIPEHAQALAAQVRAYFQTNRYRFDLELYPDGASLLAEPETLDLVLLDWKLPGGSGMDVAEGLARRTPAPAIIFVSAYPGYVFESFAAGPIWFLLKPVSDDALKRALDRFLEFFDRDLVIELSTPEGKEYIRLRDIMYIEANRKRAIVRCRGYDPDDASVYVSLKPLSELAMQIRSPRFFRTHKSYLVNMDYIERIEGGLIYTSNGEKVELSRRNRSAFEQAYNDYLKRSLG